MKNLTEVASYLHHLASHRSGIASEHKWEPHDTRDASEPEIRRRARFVLLHVTDAAIRNDERFKMLAGWVVDHG